MSDATETVTATCSVNDLAWNGASTQRCRGAWKYWRHGNCQQRDPSCGAKTVCYTGWNTCANWSFGGTYQYDSNQSVTSFDGNSHAYYVGSVCTEGYYDDSGHYHKPVCRIDTATANDTCNMYVSLDVPAVAQAHGVPGSAQAMVQLMAAPTLTYGSYTAGQYPVTCSYRIEYPVPATSAGEVCGCTTPLDYPTCTVNDDARCLTTASAAAHFSGAGGQTLADLKVADPLAFTETPAPSGFAPLCTSGDDLPLSVGNAAQERSFYSRLQAELAEVTDSVSRATIVASEKELYELAGADLDETQRADARAKYESDPMTAPSCGVAVQDLPIPTGCTGLDGTRGDLLRCQRLADVHVTPALASREYLQCVGLLDRYTALEASSANDTTCGGDARRALLRPLTGMLLTKQFLAVPGDTSLGASGRQLYLIDRWYDASARLLATATDPDPAALAAELSSQLSAFWRAIDARTNAWSGLRSISSGTSATVVEPMLQTAAQLARSGDQDVVGAAFTPIDTLAPDGVAVGRTPIRGGALLAVVGDGLSSLGDRLGDLSTFHDFACLFRSCAPTGTPVASLWQLVGALDNSAQLAAGLAQNSASLDGWRSPLQALQSNRAYLDAALATGSRSGQRLLDLIANARLRSTTYAASGLFDPASHQVLYAGVDQQSRDSVRAFIQTRASALSAAVADYRTNLGSLVQQLIGEIDGGATQARITSARLEKATAYDNATQDLAGLQASVDADNHRFADIVASFAAIKGAIDSGAYFQAGQTTHFEVSAADAKYAPSSLPAQPRWVASPASVAAKTLPGLTGGTMLSIRAGGTWSPTCALRSIRTIMPDNTIAAVDVTGALVGPDGFSLRTDGTTFLATSASDQRSNSSTRTIGVHDEICIGVDVKSIGLSAKECASVDQSWSWSKRHDDTETTGTDNRVTASFASGLRLPITPYPDLPVGSLLLVLTYAGTDTVADVRVVQSGNTVVALPKGPNAQTQFDAYFVVNDIATCSSYDWADRVAVDVVPLTTVGAEAAHLVDAMSSVLSQIAAQRAQWIDQGRVLPSQSAALKSQAISQLQTLVGHPLDSYPPALMELFTAFVDHEIVQIERAVEIRSLERSMDQHIAELASIDADLAAGNQTAELRHLLATWTMRNLDGSRLRGQTTDLLSVTRDYLHPILELWYPSVIPQIASNPALDHLLAADLDTRFVDLSSDVANVLSATLDAYAVADFGHKPSGATLPVIALSFPRPNPLATGIDDPDFFGDPTQLSAWRRADPARAKQVWDAVYARADAPFTVTPEDVYALLGGQGVLPCSEAVPVVKSMAVYAVRNDADLQNAAFNDMERFFAASATESESFATAAGPDVFHINNGVWQQLSVRALYGNRDEAINTFRSKLDSTRVVGLSPFSTFMVPFAALDAFSNGGSSANGIDDGQPSDASELVLVMQLDSQQIYPNLGGWIARCR